MRKCLRFATFMAMALVLCNVTGVRPASAASKRINFLAGYDIGYMPFYVAHYAGLFKKYGLDITPKFFTSGKKAVNAEPAGAGVGAVGGQLPSVTAASLKGPVKIVGATTWYEKNTKVISLKSIRKASDLRGKRVGLVLGSQGHLFLARYLQMNGMKESDVTIVTIGRPDALVPAFARGDVKAISVWEPFASKALEVNKNARTLAFKGVMKSYQIVTMRKDFLRKNRGTAVKILRALNDAIDFIKKNPEKAAEYTERLGRVKKSRVLELMPIFNYGLVINKEFMATMTDTSKFLAKKARYKGTPPPAEEFVDPSLLREAVPSAVQLN